MLLVIIACVYIKQTPVSAVGYTYLCAHKGHTCPCCWLCMPVCTESKHLPVLLVMHACLHIKQTPVRAAGHACLSAHKATPACTQVHVCVSCVESACFCTCAVMPACACYSNMCLCARARANVWPGKTA